MSIIQRLTPTNLLEEKEKFFADNSYNPQFKYDDDISDIDLEKYGTPTQDLVATAKNILDKAFHNRNEQDLLMMEGREVGQKEVEDKLTAFLKMHNLEERYKISWSASFISRTSISRDTIRLRLPVSFRSHGLLGMLYHEIGTHALRRVNYEKQPWFKKKKTYGLTNNYLETEEGLAVLHSLIPQPFKLAYKAARYYVASSLAQKFSFSEMWKELKPFIQDEERRWITIIRQKRGLTDTSQPGGYTKDMVYFSGMNKVYTWLTKNNFSLEKLYLGKIALEDVDKALELSNSNSVQLPSFYTTDKDNFVETVTSVANSNELF